MKNALEKAGRAVKKLDYNSPVILTFALLSFVSLLLGFATGGKSTNEFFMVYQSSFAEVLTYVRFFGHVLGHADFNHFLSNFLMILILGPLLEEKYGSKRMLFMILLTAFVTGLINFAFFAPTRLLGASGVVFMLILLSSFANMKKGRIPITFILTVSVFIGREIHAGFLAQDNISHISHIIGGLCGALLGYIINRNKCKRDEAAAAKAEEEKLLAKEEEGAEEKDGKKA
ncbi:MAG: rhomboid family intramembrane serine protease [Clostridiales bacterium]|jgi:GlpG protein|nr:rhomboid family intramembrane serine protease [Clostridiales bacterium]